MNGGQQKGSRNGKPIAASNNTKAFFSPTKIVDGPSIKVLNPLRSKDGSQLLKDPASISSRSRWKEHFEELLNRDPM